MLATQEPLWAFTGPVPLRRMDGSGITTEGDGWTIPAAVGLDALEVDVCAVS